MANSYPTPKIRLPLLLLTLVTVTPVVILVISIIVNQRTQSRSLQISHLRNIAKLAATQHSQVVEGARQLLISISTSSHITSQSQCNNFLSDLLKKYQRYNNFSVTNIKGNVLCGAVSTGQVVNVSDRYSFRQAIATRDFAVGEFSTSRITSLPVLNFSYPLINTSGDLTGVVYTSLDLSWLNQFLTEFQIDPQMVILILDRQGVILARNPNPDLVGEKFSSQSPLPAFSSSSGTVETTGADSINRLYAYEFMDDSPDSLIVAVGLPNAAIYAQSNHDFYRSLLLLSVIAGLSIIFGWFVGNYLIVQIVKAVGGVDQLKRDFVSLVSHQIRTPLTGIKYLTEILLSQSPGELQPKQNEFLTDILSSTNRLASLVTTLLNIAKLESGKIVPDFQMVNLKQLIIEVRPRLANFLTEKQVRLIINYPRSLPKTVRADPRLLSQVLENLLSNAAKYSNPKTVVTLTIATTPGFVQFTVSNHGLPIPPTDNQLVFTKFYRSPDAKRAAPNGSGLGLYLCQLIIAAHGGKIWFTSSEEHTQFHFTLPI